MTSGGKAGAWWRTLLLSLLFCAVVLAKDAPEVHVTKVDNLPANLRYFEDSDSVLYLDAATRNVHRSDDAGVSWKRVDDIEEGKAAILIMHPYEPQTAFVITETLTHYKTTNRGAKWKSFSSGAMPSAFQQDILNFHAGDPDRIIFNGMDCENIFCDEESTYTTDGFETVKLLRAFTAGCRWAKATPQFSTGDKDVDKSRTMCVVTDPFSFFKEDQRLHISDDYFDAVDGEIQEFEPNVDTNKGVSGVVNMAFAKKYLLVATSSFMSDEMALFVTDDTLKWHRAMFPSDDTHDHSHQINQEAYTVLESTNYSIQIDVMTSHPSNPMGVLFTSNSNGTYFTENVPYTNRNERGLVDFEQITGIQGVYLINVVDNGPEVDEDGDEKDIVTKITFDDGRTFQSIKAGDDTLHLHSFTEPDNVGRVFSSTAPGLVMGNGNTGKSLGEFIESDLYVSDDAGVSWKKALKGPHKYEFGDSGSVLVAVKDSRSADVGEFSYSLNHGDDWESVTLPNDLEIRAGVLTTTPDSTSLKFLLLGEKDDDFYIIAIDFDGLHERTCGDKDMEDWHARVDDDGKPSCIMGHKQTYRRRKKTADCFIKDEFHDPAPKTEDCECSDSDFECDYNFQRDKDDNSVCKQIGPIATPDGACKGDSDTFRGSSGWRLIPGNTCKRQKGEQKDDEIERECSNSTSPLPSPGSGEVSHTQYEFDADLKGFEKIYLERGDSSTGSDETIIVRPAEPDADDDNIRVENKLWISFDHGKKWQRILEGEKIRNIFPHQHFKDAVYFTTTDTKVIYTIDRGHSFHTFKTPTSAGANSRLTFHSDKKDWLIWIGDDCEEVGGKESCVPVASVSTDRGDNWKTLVRYATKCEFTGQSAYKIKDRDVKQVVCTAREEERSDAPLTIVSSNDFFVDDKSIYKGEATDFATMSEFIVAAGEEEDTGNLLALASMDGKHFEEAHFPYNFHADHQSRYTVLDSSTHAVNLFVLTEGAEDHEYGSIIKSNSNGTSYVLSASNVNCNSRIYVDFEKVSGLEGVALINVVTNTDKKEKTKKLQTKISHNDGTEWGYLPPPAKDVDGKSYKCSSKGDESCALHLHHYTERDDKRDTFAATTAVGLMFGVGNVGSTLGDIKDADTFMTADGGITWMNVKKGHWTWQYGDQGSVIVLVETATRYNSAKTNKVSYSIDEGKSWADYVFSEDEVTVTDITTLRSGTSRNFLLWCRSGKDKMFSVNLDFTGLADKPCELRDGTDSDYYPWSPKHPLQDDDCVFGHVAKYLRKKSDRKCYNDQSLQRLYDYSNCECSRRDYECAYNYELDNHGQCNLVRGLEPLSGAEWCKQHPNNTVWFEPTGYRRVPLSTCENGKELDKTSTEHPCEGYEEEFEKKHRTSAVAIFFAVIVPVALAGGIGWYVYRNWSGKIGQIRLGEDSATFDSSQPWIKYPLMAATTVVALLAAVPLLAARLVQSATGAYDRVGGGDAGGGRGRSWFAGGPRRFTTRDSFARGRGDYSMVDDEGELLGEDSDEEA